MVTSPGGCRVSWLFFEARVMAFFRSVNSPLIKPFRPF
jgi:hypothetical protein